MTAAPAGCLARIGAVAGGGTPEQIECLGRFFEDVGLAFQIVDDVLNLRGFKNDLKSKGEDIQNGSITLPVAKAMAVLNPGARRELVATLRSQPQDLGIVAKVIDQLEACGAVQACADESNRIVDEANTGDTVA